MIQNSDKTSEALLDSEMNLNCYYLPDGTIVSADDNFCAFLGYSFEELLKLKFHNLIFEEDREAFNGMVSAINCDDLVSHIKCRVYLSNHIIKYIQWKVYGVFIDNGKPIGYQVIGREETVRKTA